MMGCYAATHRDGRARTKHSARARIDGYEYEYGYGYENGNDSKRIVWKLIKGHKIDLSFREIRV